MATYEKLRYDLKPFQEGNDSDIELELEENFPNYSDITLQVRNAQGAVVISKTKSGGAITVSQAGVVRIPITPNDTLGKYGDYVYEIDFKNLEGKPFITMGGKMRIDKQINTL